MPCCGTGHADNMEVLHRQTPVVLGGRTGLAGPIGLNPGQCDVRGPIEKVGSDLVVMDGAFT